MSQSWKVKDNGQQLLGTIGPGVLGQVEIHPVGPDGFEVWYYNADTIKETLLGTLATIEEAKEMGERYADLKVKKAYSSFKRRVLEETKRYLGLPALDIYMIRRGLEGKFSPWTEEAIDIFNDYVIGLVDDSEDATESASGQVNGDLFKANDLVNRAEQALEGDPKITVKSTTETKTIKDSNEALTPTRGDSSTGIIYYDPVILDLRTGKVKARDLVSDYPFENSHLRRKWSYDGKNKNGQISFGNLYAEDEEEAIKILEGVGITPKRLRKLKERPLNTFEIIRIYPDPDRDDYGYGFRDVNTGMKLRAAGDGEIFIFKKASNAKEFLEYLNKELTNKEANEAMEPVKGTTLVDKLKAIAANEDFGDEHVGQKENQDLINHAEIEKAVRDFADENDMDDGSFTWGDKYLVDYELYNIWVSRLDPEDPDHPTLIDTWQMDPNRSATEDLVFNYTPDDVTELEELVNSETNPTKKKYFQHCLDKAKFELRSQSLVKEGGTKTGIYGEITQNQPVFENSNTGEVLNDPVSVTEDTVKQGNNWVNKGKEGTHGKFKTKKAADAQRKAMFANGYKANEAFDGEEMYGFEAMSTPDLEAFQAVLAKKLDAEGSIGTLEDLMDNEDLPQGFIEQVNFIKNTCDLSNTNEVLNEVLSAAETLLDDYQIETLVDQFSEDISFDSEDEEAIVPDEEYEEPEDWSRVDEIEETVEEPVEGENAEDEVV